MHTWTDDSTDVCEDKGTSIYKSSYKQSLYPENRHLVTSRDKETTAHGIGEEKNYNFTVKGIQSVIGLLQSVANVYTDRR